MIKLVEGVNFKWHLEYDWSDNNDCISYGCHDEGICRCSSIEDAKVTSVNVNAIAYEIYGSFFDNSLSTKRNYKINSILGGVTKEIDIYTIDRILRINKAYLPDNWEVQICNGYYGQEIDEILLECHLAIKIEEQIEEALSIISLTDRIEYLLILEYGSVLPELKSCEYTIETIERDSIIFGSDEHYRKVNEKELEHYSDKRYHGIRGIALDKGDRFRLIDGYHRCSTSENMKIKLLIAR